MQEFVRRMMAERDDLSGKIMRAKKALAHPPYGSDADGMRMLAEQVKVMESYLHWLSRRIEHEAKE